MPQPEQTHPELSEQLIKEGVSNYIDCLNLPSGSQILVITDKLSEDTVEVDPNVAIRRKVSGMIASNLSSDHRVEMVVFDHSMNREEMLGQTQVALDNLDLETNITTTVIYMGDMWANRSGIYEAASDFGESRKVRVAGSLGFTTGDCRVMSQLTPERKATIAEANNYFEEFFIDHPSGSFIIQTPDEEGNEYTLELDYDTSQASFESEMGQFGDEHKATKDNFEYVNIPGGEKYGSPFPFKNANGQFIAEGICFDVQNGMIMGLSASEKTLENIKEPSQKLLISIIQAGGEIPLSELGLGFYALAGIETYSDSSVLSREKGGPHIGMGNAPGESPEAEEMKKLSGDFHHTDFVMDNPVITHKNSKTEELTHFYPPQK